MDLTGSDVLKPGVELFSCACMQHMSELLDQLIGPMHIRVQRPKELKRLLFFQGKLFGWTAKKKENSMSCKYWRTCKLIGSLGILPSFWKETNKLFIDRPIRMSVETSYQFPIQLSDIVAASA